MDNFQLLQNVASVSRQSCRPLCELERMIMSSAYMRQLIFLSCNVSGVGFMLSSSSIKSLM